MDHLAIIEFLDHYFNGPPSEEDQKKLEQYRNADPKFEEIYKTYEQKVQGIRSFRRAELKAELRKHLQDNPVPKEVKEEEPIVRKIRWKQWRNIAAACLIFLTCAGLYRYQTRMDRWYTAFAPDRISEVDAGNAVDHSLQLEESKKYYAEGVQLGAKEKTYPTAIETLQKIPSEIDYYYFWAQYEIALVYLRHQKEGEAKKQLEKITRMEGEHIAKDKAKKLLHKMNNWMF